MTNSLLRKGVSSLLAVIVVGSAFAVPHRAHALFGAGDIVFDPTLNATLTAVLGVETEEMTKDQILDAIAWQMANMVIQSVSKSIVNWINSGFNGSPAFVQDLERNLSGLSDAVAAEFIGQLANQLEDTPMRGTVEALAYSYYLSTNGDAFLRKQLYTLRDTVRNDQAFLGGDFREGGWRGWFALTGNRANNPHGALLNAKYELNRRIENQLEQRITELGWGNGFLSWRGDCADRTTTTTRGADGNIDRINAPVPSVNLGGEEQCADAPIETPGSVIESQLNQTLAGGQQRLQVADEINEIVGALVAQLVNEALQGLSGIGSVSSGGSGYIDRASDPSQNGTSNTVDDLLLTGIEGQIAQVGAYQTSWQKIRTAAEAAERCEDLSDEDEAMVADAKTQADAALVRAASALASLQGVLVEVREPFTGTARNVQTLQLPDIAKRYQALVQNPAVPSTVEVEEARSLASDITDPPSLYVELTRMAQSCAPVS